MVHEQIEGVILLLQYPRVKKIKKRPRNIQYNNKFWLKSSCFVMVLRVFTVHTDKAATNDYFHVD